MVPLQMFPKLTWEHTRGSCVYCAMTLVRAVFLSAVAASVLSAKVTSITLQALVYNSDLIVVGGYC